VSFQKVHANAFPFNHREHSVITEEHREICAFSNHIEQGVITEKNIVINDSLITRNDSGYQCIAVGKNQYQTLFPLTQTMFFFKQSLLYKDQSLFNKD
jgi:hypothetical protein